MQDEHAALLAASREVRAAAHEACERARATVRDVEETRSRLGADSAGLRALAVRRLLAGGGPDARFWVDWALRSRRRGTAAPPQPQAARETARSAAPTSRA
jgi:hypothetical protein